MVYEYRIPVDATLNISSTGLQSQTQAATQSIGQTVSNQKQLALTGALSAQFLVEQSSRLLNATGNQQLANTISTGSRYAFLGVRALGGDVTAMATLAVSLASKALEEVRKQAEQSNEIDNARIKSGLMNMEGVRMRKNFFTGRQQYNRS